MTPYILLGRRRLQPESKPSPQHVYDSRRQLWVDMEADAPVVCCMQTRAQPTQFGETTLTETREGADRTEQVVHVSEFGETVQTRTAEGVDQTEASTLLASTFGETTVTKTGESADTTEATLQDPDAAYSHF